MADQVNAYDMSILVSLLVGTLINLFYYISTPYIHKHYD